MKCRTHLAYHEDIISKCFHGRNGRAFLISNTVNVALGAREERVLMTGVHTVSDIRCKNCLSTVGWKYEHVRQVVLLYSPFNLIFIPV